eukprot:CAMPEP_0198722998 /NCGR_PEP_ID=MMETSP1475-20131203/570_1 /TAXON_ID= ORGANISM="Unidentified sp., Strain CCMP1999" /NCGR_SAMPLE_ID=MMETSP1475 /ASSEMBLY_ACC=CAM_ASM_001111 /LENGTH=422 /DNA_ID=CAMNT_0044483971 /DNA_START=271 /DNA_END=1539 /DNA_ORIENTATION=+
MAVGAHYGKHSLSAMGPDLLEVIGLNRKQFGLIFSFQELPGIVLPLYAGVLVSLVSYHSAALLLTSLVLLGQTIVTVAAFSGSFGAILVGRLVFGLGDGALVVLQGSIIGNWFAEVDESKSLLSRASRRRIGLSTAFGVQLLASRVSSFSALGTPALIAANCPGGVLCSLVFACGVCAASFAAGCLFFAIFKDTKHACVAPHRLSNLPGTLRRLPTSYWLLTTVWIFTSSAFFSFLHFAPDIFSKRYFFSHVSAGVMSACTLAFAAVVSPMLGAGLDKFGHRPDVLIIASMFMCLSMLRMCMPATLLAVNVSVALLGIGFALSPVTLLSSVALITEGETLAMSLALFKCAENFGMAITHFTAGWIADATGHYTWTLVFFLALCVSALLSSIVVRNVDVHSGAKLSQKHKRQRSITLPIDVEN